MIEIILAIIILFAIFGGLYLSPLLWLVILLCVVFYVFGGHGRWQR